MDDDIHASIMPVRSLVSAAFSAMPSRLRLALSLAGLGLLLNGCNEVPALSVDWRGGPFFSPTNVVAASHMPADVRRVAVLPLVGVDALPAESAGAVVSAAQGALLATGRFEIVTVPPEVMRAIAGKPTLSAAELLPPQLFERMGHDYGADAILFVEVTLYRPYAPLALGVRAKLARCDETHAILWAFDTLYDVRDPAVANSARRHASGGHEGLVETGSAALQSPGRFAAYVFADVFATLPRRPPPVPLRKSKVSGARAD